jgi:membrane associated rhomboid family serine protease
MFPSLLPVTRNLLIINIIIFFGTMLTGGTLYGLLALSPPDSHAFQPYQFVTYMFMHATIGHIFFNMLALWMFGSDIEQYWGPKKFLGFYLVCGICSALAYLGVNFYKGVHVPMSGASGAVMGILAAYGFMFPNRQLMLLFPPIPIRVKYMVIIIGVMDLYAGIANNPGDRVAHFAHLGGLLAGAIILLYWKQQGRLYN